MEFIEIGNIKNLLKLQIENIGWILVESQLNMCVYMYVFIIVDHQR